jgi:Holliday junction resolvasome RuvABC endonuclease subunit
MHIGIDPGTVNMGIAITDDDGKLLYSDVLNSRELGSLYSTVHVVIGLAAEYNTKTLGIERFVAYKGMHSKASEEILMLIGALQFVFESAHHSIKLVRAIEWKPTLCKYLVRTKGFDNPSTSFDKKYSRAAAECITGQKLKTDHEADAVCLSYIWKLI